MVAHHLQGRRRCAGAGQVGALRIAQRLVKIIEFVIGHALHDQRAKIGGRQRRHRARQLIRAQPLLGGGSGFRHRRQHKRVIARRRLQPLIHQRQGFAGGAIKVQQRQAKRQRCAGHGFVRQGGACVHKRLRRVIVGEHRDQTVAHGDGPGTAPGVAATHIQYAAVVTCRKQQHGRLERILIRGGPLHFQ